MKLSNWLRHVPAFLLCSTANAFSARGGTEGGGNEPTHRRREEGVAANVDATSRPSPLPSGMAPAAALAAFALWLPLEPASAAPFDEFPSMPIPSTTRTMPSTAYNLPESETFKMLRRERILSAAAKEVRDLQELQDSRLRACEDKGKFWEQCFMYGQNDGGVNANLAGEDRGQTDYQLISPVGSLNPPSDSRKIPTW